MPPSITFLRSAQSGQGRWFVQAYGEFKLEAQSNLNRPALAELVPTATETQSNLMPGKATPPRHDPATRLRLHVLGDVPMKVYTALSPDARPAGSAGRGGGSEPGRASLILRREARQGETLTTVFVSLFEPVGAAFPPLRRVGRVSSAENVVVVLVETVGGPEYVMINLEPGTIRRVALPGGRYVSFDGQAVRVRENGLVLAGGTFAEGAGKLVAQPSLAGRLTCSVRRRTDRGLGWFVTADRLRDDPALAGRTLTVQHGDGTCRSWTLDSIEEGAEGTRLHVREETGFTIDPSDGTAHYFQFPQITVPGPHLFRLSEIAR
jgi:hypothetical protein